MQKWNIQTDRAQRVDKKWGYLHHVYSRRYGYENVADGLFFFLSSVDDSNNNNNNNKKQEQSGKKYLGGSERYRLALSGNGKNY